MNLVILFLIILSIERDWVLKKKQSYFFESFLIILFQNILLLKECFACNGCFRLFSKIIEVWYYFLLHIFYMIFL